jgi:hypothetical protein
MSVKHDQGKPQLYSGVLGCFPKALEEIAKVTAFGEKKYTKKGWLAVADAERRYKDALLRHLMADEEVDPESRHLHLAHMAWNALAVLELHLRDPKAVRLDIFDFFEKVNVSS